ncbi:uncharacterized protein DS421_7g215570 [Arachis hypogaea]|nr:uncharacterized protein DS421_7g215570 [Arachis hypogaea]
MRYSLRDGSGREVELIKIHLPLIRPSSATFTRSLSSPIFFRRGASILRGSFRYPPSCKNLLSIRLLNGNGGF